MSNLAAVNTIFVEDGTEWFGTSQGGQGPGTMYTFRPGYHDVSDYRQDNPGVRFVRNGVQYRNFDHPHSALVTTRHLLATYSRQLRRPQRAPRIV